MRNVVLVFVLAAALTIGCMQLSAEDIAKKMQEKYESIKDMKGTMVVTTEFQGGEKQVYEAKFLMKKPDKYRSEDANSTVVSNGSVMWIYDRQKNEVTVIKLPRKQERPDFDYGRIIKDMLEKYDVKLVGEEKVAGRDCYVIELKPKNKTYLINQKLWIDKDYWYPLRIEINYGNFSSIVEYKDVEFNIGISDKEFEFKPPEGAKVVEKEFKLPEKLSIDEAQQRVNFTIVKPNYTAGYTFDYAMVFKGFVQLYYKKGDDVMVISERVGQSKFMPDAKKVKIKNVEGEIAEVFGRRMLKFPVNNLEITIAGKLSEDEIVKIAESMV